MNPIRGRRRRVAVAVRLAAVLVLTLVLSGCIKMDVDLTLHGDKADGSMIIGVNRQVLEMSGQSVDDFLADINANDGIPEGATVRPYEDDVFVGQEYVLDDVDIAELTDEDMSISYDAEAGTYDVNGALDLSDIGSEVAGLGNPDISVSMTFPGEVTDHNGTLEGNTVTWAPVLGETNEMRATARDGRGSGLPVELLVAIGVVGVLVLTGFIVYRVVRRSDPEPLDDPSTSGDTRPIDYPVNYFASGEPDDTAELPVQDRPTGG